MQDTEFQTEALSSGIVWKYKKLDFDWTKAPATRGQTELLCTQYVYELS